MKIKTVIDKSADAFDEAVNAALEEGYVLTRRISDQPDGFIAEMVLLDPEPEPDPVAACDPLDLMDQLREFCDSVPRPACQDRTCPLSHYCDAMVDGKDISEWKMAIHGEA